MIRLFYIIIFLSILQSLCAQSDLILFLDSVSINNKTIAASRQYTESLKIGARTGNYLPNPSVSFDKLNHPTGSYSELVISQSFDFPTSYIYKNKIADLSGMNAEEGFRQTKLEVLTSAVEVYSELIYLNRTLKLLERREMMASRLKAGVERKIELGDATIFEVNRIQMEFAKAQSEKQIFESRKKSLLIALSELNGGKSMLLNDTVYPQILISDTVISKVTEQNPQLKQLENEARIAQKDIKLKQSLSFPKFEVGYRQDTNTGQTFNGIHAGITIPLFENKNTVKSAKARQVYAEKAIDALELSLQSNVSRLYAEYVSTQKSVTTINDVFKALNTPALLLKAYDAGEINFTEFFAEYDHYLQSVFYIEELNQKATTLQLKLYVLSNRI